MDIGLIGCGRVSEICISAYKNTLKANIIAVSDVNFDRAKALTQKYNIKKIYNDCSKIFELKDLDFVDISTPISKHAKIACETAKYACALTAKNNKTHLKVTKNNQIQKKEQKPWTKHQKWAKLQQQEASTYSWEKPSPQ